MTKISNGARTAHARGTPTIPKRVTKKYHLIRMLNAKTGAELGAISAKFGWQVHTTRAALTGLRKAGYELSAEKAGEGKPTRYRITAPPGGAGVGASSVPAEVSDAG